MSDQRTSGTVAEELGVVKQWDRMVSDFASELAEGPVELELAKGHPMVKERFFAWVRALVAERRAMLPFEQRPVWKKIRIGTHKSKQDLQKATEKEGHKFSDWGKRIINNKKFTVVSAERELGLFEATVAELGFPNGARVDAIYAKLDELGFGKCPDETALQLRRVYKDQPMNEWRIVVSEPLVDARGDLDVLYVGRDSSGSWVRRSYAFPDDVWFGGYRLVFCRK